MTAAENSSSTPPPESGYLDSAAGSRPPNDPAPEQAVPVPAVQKDDLPAARTWVLWVVVFTCTLRLCIAPFPETLSYDETSALYASSYSVAERFWATPDWSERWHIVAAYSAGAKIFWALGHVLWGGLFPTYNGVSASALTAVCAIVMMISLAGAARNLAGARGWIVAILIITLSPLFTNYSIRNLGTMQSVMWLCVSLFMFTSRLPGWLAWMGGGLGFSLAFGAHYGTGIPILCTGIALVPALPHKLFSRATGLKGWARVREVFLWPLLGVVCSVLPLLLVELWARHANDSYFARVTTHENLNLQRDLGPYGLWLRYLFELDPLVLVWTVVAVAAVFMIRDLALWRRLLLLLPFAGLAVILFVALRSEFFLRAFVSLSLSLVLGVGVAWFARFRGAREPALPVAPPISVSARIPPIGPTGLWLAVVALIVFFTYGREVSGMSRLLFTGWPILVLALACFLARCPAVRLDRLAAASAVVGGVFFVIAIFVLVQAKSTVTRAGEFQRWHKNYFAFPWDKFPHPDEYKALVNRADDNFVILGHTAWLWPASAYEEEYFKIKQIRETMEAQGFVRQARHAEFIVHNIAFFRMKPDAEAPAGAAPPPDTPIRVLQATDVNGGALKPYVHPWRGVQLYIPAGEYPGGAEVSAVLEVPAHAGDDVFGFSLLAQAALPPEGIRLDLVLESGPSRQTRPIQLINLRPTLLSIGSDDPKSFRVPLTAESSPQPVTLRARLFPLPGVRVPPLSVYVGTPFFFRVGDKTKSVGLAIVASDEYMDRYASFDAQTWPMAFTRAANGMNGSGVEWTAGPADPAEPGVYYFAGSFEFSPVCRLSLPGAGRDLVFTPTAEDARWDGPGLSLAYRHLATREGNHGVFRLALDPSVVAPPAPLALLLRIEGGETTHAWFGIRPIPDPKRHYIRPVQ